MKVKYKEGLVSEAIAPSELGEALNGTLDGAGDVHGAEIVLEEGEDIPFSIASHMSIVEFEGDRFRILYIQKGDAKETIVMEKHPCAKGISLAVLGPGAMDPTRPFRGEVQDLGIEGHTQVWRIVLRDDAPWCVLTNGNAVEGGVEDLSHDLIGGHDPETWRVVYLREGARIREYGYKGRTSTDYILEAGVLRKATAAEKVRNKEGTSRLVSLGDKLKEAGICP